MSRPTNPVKLSESGVLDARTIISYHWGLLGGEDYFGVTTTHKNEWSIDSKDMVQTLYTNTWGQQVGQVAGGSTTLFEYDLLNQLEKVTDPEGVITTYEYDAFGRMTDEVHDDRGTSTFTYDWAGNLTSTTVDDADGSGTLTINMDYRFNRLTKKTYPGTNVLNDLTYVYGSLNDGANGAGRVTQVVQGVDFKTENYRYDDFGNRVYEEKAIKVPHLGELTYITTYRYDPWGRINSITLPDEDKTSYIYTECGELERMVTKKQGEEELVIIDNILYDGYGNISEIMYGNGTNTKYNNDAYTKRLKHIDLSDASQEEMLNKSIEYDHLGNVTQIQNTAEHSSGLGKRYFMKYLYDENNRLNSVTGSHFDNNDYHLEMAYDNAGSIILKDQRFQNHPAFKYKYQYQYGDGDTQGKKHQIEHITNGPEVVNYDYDFRGNITEIYPQGDPVVYDAKFLWNEDNHLQGVQNSQGIHHYVYDQDGQRILKGSLKGVSLGQNSNNQNSLYLDAYTVYVNPYFVDKPYSNGKESSKHYYMGMQRVCSSLILERYPEMEPGGSPRVFADLQEVLVEFEIEDIDLEGLFGDLLSLGEQMSQEDYSAQAAGCTSSPCKCELSPYWAMELEDIDCSKIRIPYWYHPDYPGNTEFITNASGKPHQFFFYSPWGEVLKQQDNTNTGLYNSPYRFNGKELDGETGNYYYGASYHDPKTSVWLGVDPLGFKISPPDSL